MTGGDATSGAGTDAGADAALARTEPARAEAERLAARARAYWRRNLRYLAVLLGLWALVSFGAGILWAEPLNRWRIPGTGFPLGFWFAQQGAIYGFLAIIVAYVVLANRLDRAHGVWER